MITDFTQVQDLTHNVLVRQHLAALFSGEATADDKIKDGTPAALEAVSTSSRVFNDVTHGARDIYSAMTSPFECKVKAGKETYEHLYAMGMSRKQAMCFLGKKLVVKICWEWSGSGRIWVLPVTRMPEYAEAGVWLNGLRIPLDSLVQNLDVWKSREVVKWVNARKTL